MGQLIQFPTPPDWNGQPVTDSDASVPLRIAPASDERLAKTSGLVRERIEKLLNYHKSLTVFEKPALRRCAEWMGVLLREYLAAASSDDTVDWELTLRTGLKLRLFGFSFEQSKQIEGLLWNAPQTLLPSQSELKARD